MQWWQLAIFAVAGFVMAVLSGMSGGGAGFIMTPLGILLGLTPAQAVSSGKLNGLAVTLGALGSLRSKQPVRKRLVATIVGLALAIGLVTPHVIRSLDSDAYRLIIGVLILLMIPVLIVKKVGHTTRRPTTAQKGLGGVLLVVSLFLQGAFSSGMGTLVNLVLMGLLGQSANEANITKRYSQLVLNVTIVLGVLGSGLIVWPVVIAGLFGNVTGGYLGGHIATRKGDKFTADVLLVLTGMAAVFLIATAL